MNGITADAMQFFALARVLRQIPRLGLVERLIHAVGDRHDFTHDSTEFTSLVCHGDFALDGKRSSPPWQGSFAKVVEASLELPGNEPRGAPPDVDVLADPGAVHPAEEIVGI